MKTIFPLFLVALLAGCSSQRESSGASISARDSSMRDTSTARSSRADSTSPPPADGAPMQTSAAVYQLVTEPKQPMGAITAQIVYTYTNRTGGPLYILNCNGNISPSIQRERNGVWESAWVPPSSACMSPPVVIAAGATLTDTLGMVLPALEDPFYM